MTARQFRQFVSALAILGALLNAWVLTVHTTSVALAQIESAVNGAALICHTDTGKTDHSAPGKQSPYKNCPICTGHASLHLAVFAKPLVFTGSAADGGAIAISQSAFTLDHRPHLIFNRGPPLLA